jgi:hypothetical protein
MQEMSEYRKREGKVWLKRVKEVSVKHIGWMR